MVARGGRGSAFYTLTKEHLDDLSKDRFSLVKVVYKDLTIPMPPSTLDKVAYSMHKLFKHGWTYKYSVE